MRRFQQKSSTWQLLIGIVVAEAGVALVGLGEWDALQIWTRVLICVGGFLVCLVGMFLIWKEPLSALIVQDEAAPAEAMRKCKLLGRIDLNGYYFEAYEEEEDDHVGKRFRLRSFPPIGPEREAGFIRYMIHEGFIEKRWPRLSRKIKEEAGWAFFF
jgi:hypothetical protein